MINRRQLLTMSAVLLANPMLNASMVAAQTAVKSAAGSLIRRVIPKSEEALPAIGMGTSGTFELPASADNLSLLGNVMHTFFEGGGRVIDSSPMYGEAEARVGDVLGRGAIPKDLFTATKVWTKGKAEGIAQMQASAKKMGVEKLDLIAIHNLQDWRTQIATLKAWKAEGKVRYIGLTTSHGRNHQELIEVMRTEPIDFVQFSYNIEDRSAEEVLLPMAEERGIATMINRPYQRGSLFARSRNAALPDVAADIGVNSWAQFYLKFILSHPAVTTIIPATASIKHMSDNMQANYGAVPDTAQRAEMLRVFASL